MSPSKKQKPRTADQIAYCLEVFGDKWTLQIVNDLIMRNKRNYVDFLNSGGGIATNVLADRLKSFVEHGMVTKEIDPEHKSYTIYTPTKKAMALKPILLEMMKWGFKFGPKDSQARSSRTLIPTKARVAGSCGRGRHTSATLSTRIVRLPAVKSGLKVSTPDRLS